MTMHTVRIDRTPQPARSGRSTTVVRVTATGTGVPGPTGPPGPVGPAGTPIPVAWGPTPPSNPSEGDLWLQTS